MIFDLQNIIISYSNDDEIKLKFYNKYPDKITEISLNSDVRIDLSKFTKLKKLYLPKNTTLQDVRMFSIFNFTSTNRTSS